MANGLVDYAGDWGSSGGYGMGAQWVQKPINGCMNGGMDTRTDR